MGGGGGRYDYGAPVPLVPPPIFTGSLTNNYHVNDSVVETGTASLVNSYMFGALGTKGIAAPQR